jgi:hypothetical protein
MGCTSSTEATTNDTGSPLQQEPKIKKNQTTTIVHQRPSSSCRRTSSLPIYGSVRIMNPKKHGTSPTPVQNNLRWGCDYKIADKICNYNRHYGACFSFLLLLVFVVFFVGGCLFVSPA